MKPVIRKQYGKWFLIVPPATRLVSGPQAHEVPTFLAAVDLLEAWLDLYRFSFGGKR
jgi:hypothetical protein